MVGGGGGGDRSSAVKRVRERNFFNAIRKNKRRERESNHSPRRTENGRVTRQGDEMAQNGYFLFLSPYFVGDT